MSLISIPVDEQDQFENVSLQLDKLSTLLLTANKKGVNYPILDSIERIFQLSIENEPTYGVEANIAMTKLSKISINWLVSNLSRADSDEDLERLGSMISNLTGRGGRGAITREWKFKGFSLQIREPSFVDASIGHQTWGSETLLCNLIQDQTIDVAGHSVLELGCGTAIAGLVSACVGASKVLLTDYHEGVLENCERNILLNEIDNVSVMKLDWTSPPLDFVETFDVVIVGDCIYDLEPALLVPAIAKPYLKSDGVFYVVLPMRLSFSKEIAAFEDAMTVNAWKLVESRAMSREGDELSYKYYKFIL
ncbi:hypothetical protein SmJEL517_g02177 [Synchytrium microbalum]|uniref:Uncharacterized protein n=1 Tax=Synchytrium microbalum TaxID=1806994 RepID=A0A507C8M9_9FUNG|nr:uncharacterized protein SmJEL517_g02177 [Synchytrium microbalum]TPX35499.1 hypothetical protein SmJEL517_g02177 [Synchytrium microbalum]